MSLFDNPKMTLNEFKHRIEPFLHAFPHTRWAGCAQQILDRIQFCETENPIDPEWWNLVSEDLPREAVQLGAYIIYGNQYRDDFKLDIDISQMPEVYRRPFQEFVQEMANVMVAGVDKGYTLQDNYDNGIEWQVGEGRSKCRELYNLHKQGDTDRASKAAYKIATAGFVTWAAFCYYSPEEQDVRKKEIGEWC